MRMASLESHPVLPDEEMLELLQRARSLGSDVSDHAGGGGGVGGRRFSRESPSSLPRAPLLRTHPKRQSTPQRELFPESSGRRRLSEAAAAGVDRRSSAGRVLTEDTDAFIVGQRVFVDGVKSGRIQFIGETKLGPGDWAGVVLDEPLGKSDGAVGKTRYFQCEPFHGVFSRLHRLTWQPIEGAEEVLEQMRRYGYEIVEAPVGRRDSVGSAGGSGPRRGSTPLADARRSLSPRTSVPDVRRSSLNRTSPDVTVFGQKKFGLNASEQRRESLGLNNMPFGRKPPIKSPLTSPRTSR